VNGNLSLQNMVDGFVDEYVDETGIDTANAINTVYDTVTDSYSGYTPPSGQTITPVMTSNTAPSGIASASLETQPAFEAFTHNNTDSLYWQAGGSAPWWVAYDFQTPTAVSSYGLVSFWGQTSYPDTPIDWTFEGWDGTSWVVEDTQVGATGWGNHERRVFTLSNTVSYSKYRLHITHTGRYCALDAFELMAPGISKNITLPSTAVAALAQPTSASVIVLEEDVDAVTLNTDLVASVSRDGGTTWTNCTLVDKGVLQTISPVTSLVPIMTSATAPSGTVTESTFTTTTGEGWRAFNGSTASGWIVAGTNTTGWLAYDFQTPQVVTQYKLTSYGNVTYYPNTWTFEGWNGSVWVILDTQIGQATAASAVNAYTFVNTVAYSKFRINVTAINGGGPFGLAEMEIWGYAQGASKRILQGSADISTQPAGTSMKYKLTTANAKNLKLHGTALNWK